MIPDATLAEWERLMKERTLSRGPLDVREWLKAAITEIRRLREIERAVWNQGLEADGQTCATLTLENQRLREQIRRLQKEKA